MKKIEELEINEKYKDEPSFRAYRIITEKVNEIARAVNLLTGEEEKETFNLKEQPPAHTFMGTEEELDRANKMFSSQEPPKELTKRVKQGNTLFQIAYEHWKDMDWYDVMNEMSLLFHLAVKIEEVKKGIESKKK